MSIKTRAFLFLPLFCDIKNPYLTLHCRYLLLQREIGEVTHRAFTFSFLVCNSDLALIAIMQFEPFCYSR